jgi:ABC-2 type transport system permease protein
VRAAGRAFLASAALQLRMQRSALLVIGGVVQPAAFLAMTLLARRGSHHVDAAGLALGMALVGLWGTTIWQTGNVLRGERWLGTLAPIIARPTSLAVVLLGKSAGSTLRATVFVVPTVVVASLAAGEPIPAHRPLPLLAAALAVLASAAVFGMLVGCLFLLTRSAGRIAEAATYPVFILGGLVVPLSLLPGWVRPLADGVSLHWGAELLHAASAGSAQSAHAWLLLLATTCAYALLVSLLFHRVVDRARRDGSLDLY